MKEEDLKETITGSFSLGDPKHDSRDRASRTRHHPVVAKEEKWLIPKQKLLSSPNFCRMQAVMLMGSLQWTDRWLILPLLAGTAALVSAASPAPWSAHNMGSWPGWGCL